MISPPNGGLTSNVAEGRYEGIARLSEIAEDVNVIPDQDLRLLLRHGRICFRVRRPLTKGSISFEWGDFTTHELMAFSDVLVAKILQVLF